MTEFTHLCKNCENEFPTCKPGVIVWGIDIDPDAKGAEADTVIQCQGMRIKGTVALTADLIMSIRKPELAKISDLEGELVRCMKKIPNLEAVINWLNNGCDPLQAMEELKRYRDRISEP